MFAEMTAPKTPPSGILTGMSEKTGIILANTGSPAAPTPEAVESYLARFLMDPRLVSLPRPIWRNILNRRILPKRSVESAEKYRLVWEDEGTPQGSPLLRAHTATAAGLAALLEDDGIPVRAAMCYAAPTLRDALGELREEGVERIIYLPLYPQSAFTQVGSCVDAFGRECERMRWKPRVELIYDYWDDPLYLKAIADSIVAAGFDASRDYLDLSFHAIPLRDVQHGDTYVKAVNATCRRVAAMLGVPDDRWITGFQSVFGPRPQTWTAPLSKGLLAQWGEQGVQRVFLCCPGFAADCLETRYDIPYELEPAYRDAYEKAHPDAPAPSFTYVPCIEPATTYPEILHHVLLSRSEFLAAREQ